MWNHHDRKNDAGDDVAHDDLNEGNVVAEGVGRDTDDGKRAGFGRDDGKTDAEPANIFTAEKVIARILLAARRPHADAERPPPGVLAHVVHRQRRPRPPRPEQPAAARP